MKTAALLPATALRAVLFAAGFAAALLVSVSAARADGPDCGACHGALVKNAVVHAAVTMGCPSCHSGIDGAKTPHTVAAGKPKGLSADQPELCYTCHDKGMFTKQTVHAAVGMGCTGCHNPHSSKHAKLLTSPVPELCFGCHDKKPFEKKHRHGPVDAGLCLTCHTPHSSDNMALLSKPPLATCLQCHGDVAKTPHAIRGFSSGGHPIGKKDARDPKRQGKKFTCASCHEPHGSDSIKLFRYPAANAMDICSNCHKI